MIKADTTVLETIAFPAVVAVVALVSLTACATGGHPESSAASDADRWIAASIDGKAITIGELDAWIKEDLFRRQLGSNSDRKLYKMRREAIDRMIDERLLERSAKSRGLEPEALLDAELAAFGPITDQEVSDFYTENKDQIQGGGELDERSAAIRSHLEGQRRSEVIAGIRSAASVKIELEEPRIAVEGTGPARGPTDAPVVIVEFSDYQCPYCRRVEATLNEILERYPKEVRWEYRHFPLPNHPNARPAAEAAVCADAQGKFWEYHEQLFAHQRQLGAPSLLQYAEEVELDMAHFEACLVAPDTRERVESDRRAGERAGARGTPAFIVNGIFMSGAQPVSAFEKLIHRELARIDRQSSL